MNQNITATPMCISRNPSRPITFDFKDLLANGKSERDYWEPVIGLEIHAQISSISKLFSRVGTRYGAPPNTQVGIFESAHPGTLPVLNKRCVEAGIKTALAFGATVNKISLFDRKHYFYPDLPAGYQITQLDYPLASNGRLEFIVLNSSLHKHPYRHSVDLLQLQLEEDSGKSIHDKDNNRVLVDLNRAGQPLMELVFAPGLRNGEEAAAMVKEVALILTRIGTCNGRMHEGALRVDANISVHRPDEPLGTRTEVKNLGSIGSLLKAVDYEIQRQIDILESGGNVTSETRSFDTHTQETISMRDKEVIQDYRFMPEPNLLPLRLHDSSEPNCQYDGSLDISKVRAKIPELPEATRQKLIRDYGLSLENAFLLASKDDLLDYFMAVMSNTKRSSKLVCNLLLNNLLEALNSINTDITNSPLSASAFGEIVDLQQSCRIVTNISQQVISAICIERDSRSPTQIVLDNNWLQLSNDVMEEIVEKILADNLELVEKYKKSKKKKLLNALMGKINKASDNRANMKIVNDVLLKKLSS
nr:glutamyl-tRNA(Gln) amidotransferase subunit B, mitochondrial-like [Cherax quadricarinatus]